MSATSNDGSTIATRQVASGNAYEATGEAPASYLVFSADGGTSAMRPVTEEDPFPVALYAGGAPVASGTEYTNGETIAVLSMKPTAIAYHDGTGPRVPDATHPMPVTDALGSTAANQAAQSTLFGAVAETAPASDTASSGLNGRLQRVAQRLTSLIGLLPAALTGSGNLKVAVTESTATQAVSGTVTANIGTVGTLATAANQAADQTLTGAVTETAPASDTASSGLNGRLQRVSQRLTSLIALLPTALSGSGNLKTAVSESLPAGTNAIGKLAANAGVTVGAVEIAAAQTLATVTTVGAVTAISNALPAGTNLLGRLSAGGDTSTVYSGTTALTPKFAKIVASASGATAVVALVATKKIRVLGVTLVANAAVNVKFQSATTPTDLTGLFYLAANGGFSMGYSPVGHFESLAGEALNINLSAAVAVGGVLTYVEV